VAQPIDSRSSGEPEAAARPRNRVLAALNADEYRSIAPHLSPVSIEFKEVLYEQGEQTEFLYFVEQGVLSLIVVMSDGEVETATVGYEGVGGVHAVLGVGAAHQRVICQIPGRALRMPLAALRRQPTDGALNRQIDRYLYALMAMLAQNVACNRIHTLEQRMSRWLLMTMDRVGQAEFALTQEFLAKMLGVRRPTVSIAGTALQRAGLIQYSRGRITILDRRGLAGASCECYARVRREFDDALGGSSERVRATRARKA
jgi:CRP-like cAMP-binding protein